MLERILPRIVVLLFGIASSAHGALEIDVRDATITAGQTGFFDVYISSDLSSGDTLDFFSIELLITTTGSTRLEFVSPQPDPQLTDSEYVFLGNSLKFTTSTPVGLVSTTTELNDNFVGGDSTFSGAEVTVTGERLLARLQVTAATLPPAPGDIFSIDLNPDASSFGYFELGSAKK